MSNPIPSLSLKNGLKVEKVKKKENERREKKGKKKLLLGYRWLVREERFFYKSRDSGSESHICSTAELTSFDGVGVFGKLVDN